MAVKDAVHGYITDNFLARKGVDGVGDHDLLLDAGIIDSMGIIQLVSFLESEFGIEVDDEDIVPDNFATVASITGLVESKRGGGA